MGSTSRTFMTGLVTVLLLAALLLLQACNRENEQSEATPASGGIVEATEQGQAAPPVVEAAAAATSAPAPVPFAVGQALTAMQEVTLFAARDSASLVLEEYAPGSSFTVLEPNDGFDAYPVNNGGAAWVRVRAADGLAGWAKADVLGQ